MMQSFLVLLRDQPPLVLGRDLYNYTHVVSMKYFGLRYGLYCYRSRSTHLADCGRSAQPFQKSPPRHFHHGVPPLN